MSEIDRIRKLVGRFRRKGVVVDANLLLLKFVGDCFPDQIRSFKRTRQFDIDDYHTLVTLVEPFAQIVTTPHMLTEVSNLAGQIDDHRRRPLFAVFAAGIALLSEKHTPSSQLCGIEGFSRLGLTDVGIADAAKTGLLVLTADVGLYEFLRRLRIEALNFYHILALVKD